ncbi:MAG: fumarate reductase/succinate dehydrogenase flavoprotein subunit, partial [Planctomycetes bacterium]|nr:fumarate reductase/succinate dehydrogenase flavoprotein subunit [Planctomycetota bacterium]
DEEPNKALVELQTFRERAGKVKVGGNIQFNPGWHLALDLKNMIDISEVVTRAALHRTESRGGHTREDFPDSDDEKWAKVNAIIRQTGQEISVTAEPLPEMPAELKELLKE